MLRKRVVGAFVVVAGIFGTSLVCPRTASAQEVINLDDDAPAPSKGGKAPKKGAKDKDKDKDKKKKHLHLFR